MRIAAILLSYKRPENLPEVVAGIEMQSCIDDLIVFHNHPSNDRASGHINIVSDINLGCIARHAIALALDYDYFVFTDDDLALTRDLSDNLIAGISEYGQFSMLGFIGQQLNFNAADKPYTKGQPVKTAHIKPIDIVKGRFHIIAKPLLGAVLSDRFNTKHLISEDDIRANVAIQHQTGRPSYLLPLAPGDIRELPTPHALEHRKHHYQFRDSAILDAMRLGWEPSNAID